MKKKEFSSRLRGTLSLVLAHQHGRRDIRPVKAGNFPSGQLNSFGHQKVLAYVLPLMASLSLGLLFGM